MMYLLDAMQDREAWCQMQTKIAHCGVDKIKILWEIFFETDIYDVEICVDGHVIAHKFYKSQKHSEIQVVF